MSEKFVICGQSIFCGNLACFHKNAHIHVADAGCDDLHCGEAPGNTPCIEVVNAQQQAAKNTADRGYRKGWTAKQFAARQVCKLAERLGKLAKSIRFGGIYSHSEAQRQSLHTTIAGAGYHAGWNLDDQEGWENCEIVDVDFAKSALADVQAAVFALAEVLGEVDGEPFDVIQAAVEKSAADVDRGVA